MLIALLLLAGCHHGHRWQARHARIAEAKSLIADNCGACHRVPGVPGTEGRVGPSLEGIGRQMIIAGHFVNTPDNLARWMFAVEFPLGVVTCACGVPVFLFMLRRSQRSWAA